MGLATPVGAGFRKLGPDVRIDREERRDGTGLLLLLLAALIAAVEWWGLRGTAIGRVVHGVVGGTVGWFALLVPIALLVVAVRCFRHATDHRANGRIIIGLLMATVAGSGIAHLVGGVPSAAEAFEDMLGAGGMVGYLATAPLASLLTPVPVWALMILLAFFSPFIAEFALGFGSAANFMLALFALTIIASVSEGRMVKGLISGFLGLGIAMIGLDTIQGYPRLTFGSADLLSGISFIPLMIGLFAVSEAFLQVERAAKLDLRMRPEAFRANPAWLRRLIPSGALGSGIGFVIGVIPGVGGDISSFVAYNESKRLAKDDSRYGTGEPRGIAAAESAKNAGPAGAMVPTLTLGIPGDVTSAVLIGALTVHGLQPGPALFTGSPDLIYGVFAGFALVYVVLFVLGWFGTSFWVRTIEAVPPRILWPSVIVLAVVGSYAVRSNAFDVLVMFAAAVLGYLMTKGGYPLAPLIIGVILGPIAEGGFRRAMIIHDGSLQWLLEPVPLVLGILTLASIAFAIWRARSRPTLLTQVPEGEKK